MNNKKAVYYRIGGHLIVLQVPSLELTEELLPNFKPFRVGPRKGEIPLFVFKSGQNIALPKTKPNDRFEWNGIHYEVYQKSTGWILTMKQGEEYCRLSANVDWTRIKTSLTFSSVSKLIFINNFLVISYGMSAARFHTLKIHASVTEKNGKALIFLGKSGTGKSTHSLLWREFVPGCSLLNDDEPVVRLFNDGSILVFGTPWSGKAPCYRNELAKVIAFVHLKQSPENKLEQLNGVKAFSSLYTSCCLMRSNTHNKEQVLDTVVTLLERIPVYGLECRPDREAVALTETLLK